MFAEYMADITNSAVFIVGQGFYYDCRAARAIAFIGKLFIVDAFQIAAAFFYGSCDVVLGHIFIFSRLDGNPQPGVGIRITAAHTGRHGNFFNKLGKYFAALGTHGLFFMFDC